MNLAQQLEDARAKVAHLERVAAAATCAEMGKHDWKSIGGMWAACCRDCGCSVPVNVCQRCGDCDYGENQEAADTIAACKERAS